jgi:hypothetical protein
VEETALKRLRTNQVTILLTSNERKKGEKKKMNRKERKESTGQEHLVGSEGVVECVGT